MTDNTANVGVTCLLTIHGIGFQQAPDDGAGVAGYADGLHHDLHGLLGDLLSDDPHRSRSAPGQCGPIYVQSSWPPDTAKPEVRSIELGLSRLGRRTSAGGTALDVLEAPLVQPGSPIAHVALIYTPSEETAPDRVSLLETAVTGLVSIEHYLTLREAVSMTVADVGAILHPPTAAPDPAAAPSVATPDAFPGANVPRADARHRESLMGRLVAHVHGPQASPASGPLAVLRTVEDDVGAYVARNMLRERVRDFVREAVTRLAQRSDVTSIVVNAHSQGTVVAFDVLRSLPDEVVDRIAALVTLGSPLRKYNLVLNWGPDTGQLARVRSWTNMWDPMDPVADPLQPGPGWSRGHGDPAGAAPGLFLDVSSETGLGKPASVTDITVNNLGKVQSSGLRAHDYWGNVDDVLEPLSTLLRSVVTGEPDGVTP